MKKILFLLFAVAGFALEQANIHTIIVSKYGNEYPTNICREIWIDPCLEVPKGEENFSEILFPFLLKPLLQNDFKEIEQDILCYFRKYLRPLISVVFPPQNLSDGVLHIVIVEPILESVCLQGNRWTSDSFILTNSGMQEGMTLNSYEVQNDLAWLNRSPFRQTNIVLTPGPKPGTTNAELITKERFPLRVYAGADNTGTKFLTHTRIYAGFNAGNLLGLDHQASFQWTTAADPRTLTAFSGQYLAPLPYHTQLLFFGGYSKFKGDLPAAEMRQTGEAWQVSSRAQFNFNPLFGSFLQQINFGYDFKRTNSERLC